MAIVPTFYAHMNQQNPDTPPLPKTINLLLSLDKKEEASFKKFLKSPIFNTNEKLSHFGIELIKKLRGTKGLDFSTETWKHKVWRSIHKGNEPYADLQFRKLMAGLQGLGEAFLGFHHYWTSEARKMQSSLLEMEERNLKKSLNYLIEHKSSRLMESHLHKIGADHDYYLLHFYLEFFKEDIREKDLPRRVSAKRKTESIIASLDYLYLYHRTKLDALLANQRMILPGTVTPSQLSKKAIPNYLELVGISEKEHPSIYIYSILTQAINAITLISNSLLHPTLMATDRMLWESINYLDLQTKNDLWEDVITLNQDFAAQRPNEIYQHAFSEMKQIIEKYLPEFPIETIFNFSHTALSLPSDDKLIIQTLLLNLATRCMNHGATSFIAQIFAFYKTLIKEESLFDPTGKIDGSTYKNIVNIGLESSDFIFVQSFLNRYGPDSIHVAQGSTHNLHDFCRGLYYLQSNQKEELRKIFHAKILQIDFRDKPFWVDLRFFLIKAFYYLDNYDESLRYYENLYQYLRENKELNLIAILNFQIRIRWIQKLLNARLPAEKEALKKELNSLTYYLKEKNWLLDRLK